MRLLGNIDMFVLFVCYRISGYFEFGVFVYCFVCSYVLLGLLLLGVYCCDLFVLVCVVLI